MGWNPFKSIKKIGKTVLGFGKKLFPPLEKFFGTNIGKGFGSLAGAGFTGWQQSRAASANRSFQSDMAGSAYQRATADMRAAGLNPALAYQQGGASSPGGATAQVPDYSKGVDTAISAERVRQTGRLALASEADIWAATALKESQRRLASTQELLLSKGLPRARMIEMFDKKVAIPAVKQIGQRVDDASSGWALMKQWTSPEAFGMGRYKTKKREPKSQVDYWKSPAGKRRLKK